MTAPRKPLTSPSQGEVGRAAAGRGSTSRFVRTPDMTIKARRLRHAPTDAEQALWKALRRKALYGASFRRQHPVGPYYVLDFYCPSARLAVEIDGGQHALPEAQAHDRRRDAWLAGKNIRMLRFWNNEVSSNLDGVLQTIVTALNLGTTPSRRTTRADLPLAGGGDRSKRP